MEQFQIKGNKKASNEVNANDKNQKNQRNSSSSSKKLPPFKINGSFSRPDTSQSNYKDYKETLNLDGPISPNHSIHSIPSIFTNINEVQLSESMSSKKRKPFGDKQLSFNSRIGDDVHSNSNYEMSSYASGEGKLNQHVKSSLHSYEPTELPDITRHRNQETVSNNFTQFHLNKLDSQTKNDVSSLIKADSKAALNNEEEQVLDQTINSILTQEDISLLKNIKGKIDRETIDKAYLCDRDKFEDVTPYYIKLLRNVNENCDFESNVDLVDKKSSYLKTRDREEYLKNIVEIAKNDSKLYERTIQHEKKKNETKQLLLTELTRQEIDSRKAKEEDKCLEEENDEDEDIIEINKFEDAIEVTNKVQLTEEQLERKEDKKMQSKLMGILDTYNTIEKKQKQLENGNKFKNFIAPSNNGIASKAVKNYIEINKQEAGDKKMNKYAYPKISSKKNDYDMILESVQQPLSKINFQEEDEGQEAVANPFSNPFKDATISQINLGYMSGNQLQELHEIDKKLCQIDRKYEEDSIYSELKRIKANVLIEKIKSKDNEKERKGRDYLKTKREERTLEKKMNILNNHLINIPYKIPEQYEIDKIYEDLNESYARDPEKFIKETKYKITGDYNHSRMNELLKETEELLKETKTGIDNFERNLEKNDEENEKLRHEQDKREQEINNEFGPKYEELINKMDREIEESKELSKRIDEVSRKNLESETYLEEKKKRIEEIRKEALLVEENFRKYEEMVLKNMEDLNEVDESEAPKQSYINYQDESFIKFTRENEKEDETEREIEEKRIDGLFLENKELIAQSKRELEEICKSLGEY